MKFTLPGKDVIRIDEDNMDASQTESKVHLIKLKFTNPTEKKIKEVIETFDQTNRYIIEDNIRIYNYVFKYTNKKYYVENNVDDKLITFYKKNNKVLLNFLKLDTDTLFFISENLLQDVLNNTEVIIINWNIYNKNKDIINSWKGNVIMDDDCIL